MTTACRRRCRRGCAGCWRARPATPAWPAARPSTASVGRPLDAALRDMHRRKTGAAAGQRADGGAACARRSAAWARSRPTAPRSGPGLPGGRRHPRRDAAFRHAGQDRRRDLANKPDLRVGARPGGARARCAASVRPGAGAARAQLPGRHRRRLALLADRVVNRIQLIPAGLLPDINSPADLRAARAWSSSARRRAARLRADQRVQDRRAPVVNLGTVELTIALHYVFDTPRPAGLGRRPPDLSAQDPDRPARPHGHAAPAGRLSGFPRRDEASTTPSAPAHSSTSISAALGMAIAARSSRGEAPPRGGGHRRRRDDRRHGLRGAEQRRRAARRRAQPAGGAQRQRHVDQPPVGALNKLPGAPDERQVLRRRARGREVRAEDAPPLFELARASRSTPRAWWCRHHVRGVRLQLRRPDRRPRPRPLIPTLENLRDGKGARSSCTWSPRRATATWPRPTRSTTTAQVRPGAGHPNRPPPARPPSRRCSASGCATWPPRPAPGRITHPAMREGSGMVEFDEALPEALLRRRHRRAARRDLRRRAWPARAQAGGGDLLDLPAARPTTS